MVPPAPAQTTDGGAAVGYRLRLGHVSMPATTTVPALRAAIDRSNQPLRIADLPDRLNPDLVDADKALALVAALPALARKRPQLLEGRELMLDHPPLRIGSADPTTAASFAQPFELEVVDVQGETLLARSTVPAAPRLARERAGEAKAALQAENARIAPLEAQLRAAGDSAERQRRVLDTLTPAQQRRSALARVWWSNARESSEAPGADAAAKAETEAARKALDDYLLPSGGAGMPK